MVITPSVTPTECSIEPTTLALPARSSSTASLTLTDCFTATRTVVSVDLDDGGPAKAVKITGPPTESDWTPLAQAAVAGLLLAILVGLWGVAALRDKQDDMSEESDPRPAQYAALQAIVQERMDTLTTPGQEPDPALSWVTLPARKYAYGSVIENLEAGWSFKDSWVSNITVVATAFIALLTSTDALTAFLGDEPEATLGVMTVGGLIAAVVIGIANTLVKLIGPSTSKVTVLGLIVSTSVVVFAATLQAVTVGLAARAELADTVLGSAVEVLTVVVCSMVVVYGARSLHEAIHQGQKDELPAVPAGALETWSASEVWERLLVADSVRTTYAKWLEPGTPTPAPGAAQVATGGRWVRPVVVDQPTMSHALRASARPDPARPPPVRPQQVGVDDADRLHERVHRRRADEHEALALERLRQGQRLGRGRGDLGHRPRPRRLRGPERPHERREVALRVLPQAAAWPARS